MDYWIQEAVDMVTRAHQEDGTLHQVNLSLFGLGQVLIVRATKHNEDAQERVGWGFDEMDGVWRILEEEASNDNR